MRAVRRLRKASFVDTITKDLTDRTVAAATEALDTATGIVRKSPPEAILAAMAVAVVAGILVGRRRGDAALTMLRQQWMLIARRSFGFAPGKQSFASGRPPGKFLHQEEASR